jgi:hypothetical protein
MSVESNLAHSKALKGKAKNYDRMLNKTHSAEAKSKIAAAHLGMHKPWVKWSPEIIEKRAMTRRALTKDQYDSIHTLITAGISLKAISTELAISYDLVKKWSKKAWKLNQNI